MTRVAKQIFQSPYFTWLLLFIPAPSLITALLQDNRYYAEIMYESGVLATQLTVIALAITPLMKISRHWALGLSLLRILQRRRRYIGIAAFGYALLHTLFYIREIGSLELILLELEELSLLVGWIGFFALLLLAATSNDASVRKLGRWWKRLQMTAYLAAALTALHWWLIGQFLDQLYYWFLPLMLIQAPRVWRLLSPVSSKVRRTPASQTR